jgi:ABC-type uncharacterized transport system involved in gliding motility auxiliary subunit
MMGAQPLAVLVEGTFPDLWQGKAIPEWQKSLPDPAADPAIEPTAGPADDQMTGTPQPGKLFVVGSAKMFDDSILAAHQNALLLLNAVDFLAGSHELLTIRAKTLTQRVIRPTRENEKLAWRLFVVLFVPLVLTIYGIVRASVRRKNAAMYRQELRRRSGAATR